MRKILIGLLCFGMVACQKTNAVDPFILRDEFHPEDVIETQEEIIVKEEYLHPIDPSNTWQLMGEIDADCHSAMNIKTLNLYGTSTHKEDVIYQKEGICFKKNASYEISFKISSSLEKEIDFMVTNELDQVIIQESLLINESNQEYHFTITMPYYDSWNSKVLFFLGDYSMDYQVIIEDFLIKPLDKDCFGIQVNQVGYRPFQSKIASFSFNAGNYFNLYRVSDDTLVYQGVIGNGKEDLDNQEYNFQGDFSDFQEEGRYYILSETGVRSYEFEIRDDLFEEVLDDALYFMYLQRCGTDIEDERYGHSACHNQDALLYGYDTPMDVSGGWHDAGDYGRYVQTSTKALSDLMIAYDLNSETFDETFKANLLSEIRYQLEWLLKLQKEDGSVYNKVTTQSFAHLLMPEEDIEPLYVLEAWTLTTASFAASAAFGAMIFEEIDFEFSSILKEAALLSGQYLLDIDQTYIIKNPGHFTTGQYNDDNDQDERFYAFSALYRLTDDEKYLEKVKDIFKKDDIHGGLVADMSTYGYYLLLKEEFDDPFYDEALQEFESKVKKRMDYAEEECYFYPYHEYHWGSNQHLLDCTNRLLIYSHLIDQEKYALAAFNMGNYVFGNNGLGICFIDGYGTHNPEHIHHRVLQIRGGEMRGGLVGGVDQILADGNLSDYFTEESAIAKRYLDHYDSYSTNEFAIYYNSALVLYLSFLNEYDTMKQ